MKTLTPQETLQAIIDGKKLEYRWKHHGNSWLSFNPLCNGVDIEDLLKGFYYFRIAQETVTIGNVSFPKPQSKPLEFDTEHW